MQKTEDSFPWFDEHEQLQMQTKYLPMVETYLDKFFVYCLD